MAVEPYDEEGIQADHLIIRRVNPDQHVIQDDNLGYRRISTKLFTPSSGPNGGMSVDIEEEIIEAGCDPKEYVTNPVFIGSVKFLASAARELSLRIGYDPLPDNPYHGEVWGSSRPDRFTSRQKKELLNASEWYVPLEDVELK